MVGITSMSRRNGESFRKICRALAESSEGKRVAYISPNQHALRHYFDMAKSIVASSLLDDVKIMPSARAIVFPNGGRLEFILPLDIENKRRGITLHEVYDD